MKIQLMSDLHQEFGWEIQFTPHLDTVLVLAGDIDNRYWHLQDIIERACLNYQDVIMVAGNHEFYGTIYEARIQNFNDWDDYYPNFHFLENRKKIIDDVIFLGGTLWATPTHEVFSRINDAYQIKRATGRRFYHEDLAELNGLTTDFLKRELETHQDDKTVVVTHFGPDQRLMNARWRQYPDLNTYFWARGLDYHFKYADHWMFGHTHDPGGGKIDGCEFYCNPHGYRWPDGKEHWGFNEEYIIDVAV